MLTVDNKLPETSLLELAGTCTLSVGVGAFPSDAIEDAPFASSPYDDSDELMLPVLLPPPLPALYDDSVPRPELDCIFRCACSAPGVIFSSEAPLYTVSGVNVIKIASALRDASMAALLLAASLKNIQQTTTIASSFS
uniref:Uncharacterized protein n=1 Tax=Glossina austeni TaxID=7395 RepID=A0A1A9VBF4_GLOAU